MTDRPPRWMPYMSLDELEPALVNSKDHDKEIIADGISRFGLIDNVVLDERTGRLVGGHGRLEDALERRARGEHPPDGFIIEDGVWKIPVQRGWRSNSDDEAHAASVLLNQATIAGGWVDDLSEHLDHLRSVGLLDATGFSDGYLEDLLAQLTPLSLDELEAQVGPHDERRLWPMLRFRVSPTVRDRYLALVDGQPGDDADRFVYLLELAELAGSGS